VGGREGGREAGREAGRTEGGRTDRWRAWQEKAGGGERGGEGGNCTLRSWAADKLLRVDLGPSVAAVKAVTAVTAVTPALCLSDVSSSVAYCIFFIFFKVCVCVCVHTY
jgi:hypothetical protein